MFLEHFSLREDPFTLAPDPRFLYFSPAYREALASLYYSVTENRGFAVITGGAGVGKTVLLHYLDSKLAEGADVIFLSCPVDDRHELMHALLASLDVSPDPSSYLRNWRQLESWLLARRQQGRTVVLIADEAHAFGDDALKSLRLLLNLETPQAKLLQIILSGGPSLTARLASSELESVALRVNVSCHLTPLRQPEVSAYIAHRLAVAGENTSPFSEAATALIGSVAGGVPLKINRLCYQAMSCAWLQGKRHIDEDIVWKVLEDLPMPEIFVSSNQQQAAAPAIGKHRAH